MHVIHHMSPLACYNHVVTKASRFATLEGRPASFFLVGCMEVVLRGIWCAHFACHLHSEGDTDYTHSITQDMQDMLACLAVCHVIGGGGFANTTHKSEALPWYDGFVFVLCVCAKQDQGVEKSNSKFHSFNSFSSKLWCYHYQLSSHADMQEYQQRQEARIMHMKGHKDKKKKGKIFERWR